MVVQLKTQMRRAALASIRRWCNMTRDGLCAFATPFCRSFHPSMFRSFFLLLCTWLASTTLLFAADFKFSTATQDDTTAQSEQQRRIAEQLQTPCRAKIKNQKIMVLFGQSHNGLIETAQGAFNPYTDAINSRLNALGLRTATPAQIKQQVAQTEIDAYFKNDPDAAISASRRLAANYVLKGLISTESGRNLAVNVNQVAIRMDFTLTAANGKTLSQAHAENASYAGHDTAGMALTLINERADEVVATLYADYCRQTGVK